MFRLHPCVFEQRSPTEIERKSAVACHGEISSSEQGFDVQRPLIRAY
ncbi:hypothetical protein AZZ62_002480, partial [Klebsiella variicola]